MRIALLSSDYLPNIGGIAAHVHGLATGLQRIGHEVEVLVPGVRGPRGATLERGRVEEGFGVTRLRVPRLPKLTRFYFAQWAARAVERELGAHPFEVVHWHTPLREGELAARLPSTVRVFTNHTSQFLEWERDGQDRALAKRVLRPADGVISPSHELTAATISAGFDVARTWTLANGVDAVRFRPDVDAAAVRAELGIGAEEVVVLCPRRLEKKNGVTFWLRSLPTVLERVGGVRSVRFLLIGDYPARDVYSDEENVVRTIAELGLGDRLLWIRRVPNAEMPRYFAASDIAVLPSLMEATSIAGLEAMASGLPLVATRVGGIPEIVEDRVTGLLVEPASPASLAEGIAALVRDEGRRRDMGVAARAAVERGYTWEAVARQTAEVYATLAAAPQRKAS